MFLKKTVRFTTVLTIIALAAASAHACPPIDPASTSPGLGSLGLWAWFMSLI